jgi:hypothetical protein
MSLLPRFVSLALAGAFLSLGLLACAKLGVGAAAPAVAPVRQNILVDQQVLSMEWVPGTGSPAIDQAKAEALAATYLSGASQATHVDPRYVQLTLRDADGKVSGGVQARPAWLVTYTGVAYTPGGTSASVCACATLYQRPNTVVSLDAQTGALITLLGSDN